MSKSVVEVIAGPLTRPEKSMLKRYEQEADDAILGVNRSAVDLGKALWDIQNEQLYRAVGTFPEYVLARFGISKSNAYRCIQIAKAVDADPAAPVPSQWSLEPGKRAKKATQRPTGGTAVPDEPAIPEPATIDAEWSAEVPTEDGESHVGEPVVASDTRDTRSADSPEATFTSQPEVSPGSTASGGEADGDESDIGHVAEQWTAPAPVVITPADVLARLAETKPSAPVVDLMANLEASLVAAHAAKDANMAARMAAISVPDPELTAEEHTAEAIDALILLPESADLEALGAAMTADQIDTFGRAYEAARDAWTMSHKPVREMSKAQRVRAKASGVAPVAAKSGGGLGRREVQPNFKAPKVAK